MYLKRLFSDKKIKSVYSNEPNQTNLSCPANDGSKRTACKTCLKFWIKTQKMQASQGSVRRAMAKV